MTSATGWVGSVAIGQPILDHWLELLKCDLAFVVVVVSDKLAMLSTAATDEWISGVDSLVA
jgi:hypothetical protein